jgi:shikimate kinase
MKIFVMGMPASGKSYWGKQWAKELKLDFIDLDEKIESTLGKSIPEIFSTSGESFFRETESQVLSELMLLDHFVLSCGGGTPCFGDNLKKMNECGVTVFLNVGLDNLMQNLEKNNQSRPLIESYTSNELTVKLSQILQERLPFYKQSKITLSETELNPNALNDLVRL